ncbi:hypothetical protein N9061_01915 [bacterium]|nr:hypothetical protein [Mariniblastus sp.]MDB4481207.1 hypothetical protein [bacterium]MDB4483878.1 hypothetical protein [bacterium]
MRVRKFYDEEWIEVAVENFGQKVANEISVLRKQYPVVPTDRGLQDHLDETGCAHVYGQIVRIAPLFEEDAIECVACTNCKFLRLSNFSAESGSAGYCCEDGSKAPVHAAHHCDSHEHADNWKTRHGPT